MKENVLNTFSNPILSLTVDVIVFRGEKSIHEQWSRWLPHSKRLGTENSLVPAGTLKKLETS